MSVFSYEDKKRAIDLYYKYGRRIAPVVNELGFPDRHTLYNWVREYEASGAVPEDGRKSGRYTDEQKRAAVDHYLEHGKCIAFTRRELGYPSRALLSRWIDELAPGERRAAKPAVMFPIELKRDAVTRLVARDGSAKEVAEELGVNRETLYSWKRQLLGKEPTAMPEPEPKRAGAGDAAPAAEGAPGAAPSTSEEIEALERRKADLLRELDELELKRKVMEGAIGLLGKGTGGDPANGLTNREKTILVDSLRAEGHTLTSLLRAVGMKKSSYYYQVGAMKVDRDAEVRKLVVGIFDSNDGTYGRRRIRDEMAADPEVDAVVGERRISRILKEENLVALGYERRKKNRPYDSYEGEISEHPGNKVRQDFRAGLPNFLWLTDVTQFTIPAGKLYLSPVLDCFDGAIVSWTVSRSPNAEMANSMLRSALATATEEERGHLVIHSDCGCHYRWPEWISICDEAGITRSMSRKGRTPDNQRMEAFFGTMKTEMFRKRSWDGVTLDELEERINRYIVRYNTVRRKRSLGGVSPMEFRRNLGLALAA